MNKPSSPRLMNNKLRKIREELILKHLYIVHTIVFKIQKKFNTIADNEDLISIGTIGLINAVDNYRTEFGTKLSTYARRKVYGAILDYFRSEDHLSRKHRSKLKKVEKAICYLEHELGRESTFSEIAEKLEVPLEEYYEYVLETQQIQESSAEESHNGEIVDIDIEQDSFFVPDNLCLSKEFVDKLSKIILELPERERVVFCLYFYEELPMRQIGLLLDLKESRISQLLQKIIKSTKENINV